MASGSKIVSISYELTGRCNLRCGFCYNPWRTELSPPGELPTRDAINLLAKLIDLTGCKYVSLTGGEPLLRSDIYEIIRFLKSKGIKVALVTNGTLLDREAIKRCLSDGVDLFQVTLLGDRADLHNRLTGCDCFEKVIEAILDITKEGGSVDTFFVATRDNVLSFKNTLELNVLLRVKRVAFGRFTPGGAGLRGWHELMPSPGMIDEALSAADEIVTKYDISVVASMPILPCLNDLSRYTNIDFCFCAVGSDETFIAVDPLGNLKACNHSPQALGNVLKDEIQDPLESAFIRDFVTKLPEYCLDCPANKVCKGGCRSSAYVCYGSFESEDPYLSLWKDRAAKPGSNAIERLWSRCNG